MSRETSPTSRALRALEILRHRPGTTAAELAQRLGVSERAVRRYVGVLREAGIDVESVRGPYGGYRLGYGTRLPPVSFSGSEALGLVMAVLDSQPAAGGDPDDLVGSALGKVIRALPERVARQATALREHAAPAPVRSGSRPDPAHTSALVAAVAANRCVLVGYRSEAGREWTTEVDPWAVVIRHGRWYLLCHSHHSAAIRTYRLDRITEIRETGQHFEPLPDLDPVAVLEENLGSGWEHPTRVVFDASLEEVSRWVPAPMGRLTAYGAGCVLEGSTSNPTMYAGEWLARLPLGFRVEGGPELRDAVSTLATRMAAALDPPAEQRASTSAIEAW